MLDSPENMSESVAIIGLAGRFPGACNVAEFWENIKNGSETITHFSDEALLEEGVNPALLDNQSYVKAKGIIDDADLFDATFFDYSPKEAKLMDPQHRLLLETCYEARVHAGCHSNSENTTGVFVSASFNTYLLHYLSHNPDFIDDKNYYQVAVANSNDFLATRIAYKLNLTGPAQTIQTACSSSLVAVHHAQQSLLNYECDVALAGGVSITTPLKSGYLYKKDGIGSPDGKCRPFDEDAAGTVPGNGVGIVVLKRLSDALADNDTIYAVIKGSAINNDGNNKVGYTAPSVQGQADVIRLAHAIADVPAESIGLIEAHGTGTALGDPIEIEGLTRAFGSALQQKQFCPITSTKANIGHLDAASGVTGLIKTVLCLHHKQLPPSINFVKANARINFEDTPFYVNTILKKWENGTFPRRAGVSAFGIGGTNAHIVLEEIPRPDEAINSISLLADVDRPFKRERFWLDIERRHIAIKATPESMQSASNDSVKYSVAALLLELLEVGEEGLVKGTFNYDEDFYTLGADSLMLLDFQLELESRFNIVVSLAELADNRSINALLSYLGDRANGSSTKSSSVSNNIVPIDFSPTRFSSPRDNAKTLPHLAVELKHGDVDLPPLFCIHPAGGSVTIFQDLVRHLHTGHRVIGICAKGWNSLTEPDTDIEVMAREYLGVIQMIQPTGPYLLCGSSMGGAVAYEVAQLLDYANESVVLLAMIDTPPPGKKLEHAVLPETNEEILKYIATQSPEISASIANMEKKKRGSLDRFFYLWRNHRDATSHYHAKPYDGDILYFRANEHGKFLSSHLEQEWIGLAEGGIEIHTIAGNHLTMHLAPHVEKMAHIIDKKLSSFSLNISQPTTYSDTQEYRLSA